MPFDNDFANALLKVMATDGWTAEPLTGSLSNPLRIELSNAPGESMRLLVHARRITAQSSAVSDHNRPEGEMHLQMIFDGDQRGSGIKNQLQFEDNTQTLLVGFLPIEETYVIAAYDPEYHREYAYSSSLQVKRWKIQEAHNGGIALQTRQSGEVIVVFRIEEILEYLAHASDFHSVETSTLVAVSQDENVPASIRRAMRQDFDTSEIPVLEPDIRRRRVTETSYLIRDHNFRRGILQVYDCCAICGFQYDYILDAAHIVPVDEGGTDTYDNGFGLCPRCHRMFDRGYILVDEQFAIYLNPHAAEQFEQLGLAGSLDELKRTLRAHLWLPNNPAYHPSPRNLRRTFDERRKIR